MIGIHLMNGISLRVFNKQVVKYIFFIIRTCILSQIYILIIQYIYKITQNNTLLHPNNTIYTKYKIYKIIIYNLYKPCGSLQTI